MDETFRHYKRKMDVMQKLYGDKKAEPVADTALKPKKPKNRVPLEQSEQIQFISWLKSENIFHYAVPNEGKRTMFQRNMARRMGLTAGVPDVVIPKAVYPFHGLYIELKRTVGSVVSEVQHDCHAKLRDLGYAVFVAYGCDDAILITRTYLNRQDANYDQVGTAIT